MRMGRGRLEFSLQRQVILQVPFDQVTCRRPLPPGVTIRRATLGDVTALGSLARHRPEEQLHVWIRNGYFVLLAERDDGMLVGYHCLSDAHVYPRLLGQAVPLAPTEVWSADIYVRPGYRGTGVYDHLKATAIALARRHGYTCALSSVLVRNVASRKANRRIGAREVGWLVFLKAFGKTQACVARRRRAGNGHSSLRLVTDRGARSAAGEAAGTAGAP